MNGVLQLNRTFIAEQSDLEQFGQPINRNYGLRRNEKQSFRARILPVPPNAAAGPEPARPRAQQRPQADPPPNTPASLTGRDLLRPGPAALRNQRRGTPLSQRR